MELAKHSRGTNSQGAQACAQPYGAYIKSTLVQYVPCRPEVCDQHDNMVLSTFIGQLMKLESSFVLTICERNNLNYALLDHLAMNVSVFQSAPVWFEWAVVFGSIWLLLFVCVRLFECSAAPIIFAYTSQVIRRQPREWPIDKIRAETGTTRVVKRAHPSS